MNPFYLAYARSLQFVLKYFGRLLVYPKQKEFSSPNEIADFLKENGVLQVFLVTGRTTYASPSSQRILNELHEKGIGIHPYIMEGKEPSVNEAKIMAKRYHEANCQAAISLGGGSRIDSAKALCIALAYPNRDLSSFEGVMKVNRKLPLHIAIPTTAGSGSEDSIATVLIDEERHHKFAVSSPRLLPNGYYHEPTFLLEMPKKLGAESCLDSLSHSLESYLGSALSKKNRELAVSAIEILHRQLPNFFASDSTKEDAKELFLASSIGGYCFSRGYVGYIHALAHALGGKTGLPHGRLIAIMMPYVLLSYGKKAHKKLAYLADRLDLEYRGNSDREKANAFIQYIFALELRLGVEPVLDVKLSEKDIDEVASFAYKEANPLYPVPKILTKEELKLIIKEAIKNED